jgi:hypothetical protein
MFKTFLRKLDIIAKNSVLRDIFFVTDEPHLIRKHMYVYTYM